MSAVLTTVIGWLEAGWPIALATVVDAQGSTPRGVGARMAVRGDGAVCGSISASCVESEIHHAATEVLAHGRTVEETFGLPDPGGMRASLMCGGSLTVRIEHLGAHDLPALEEERRREQAARPWLLVYGAVDIATGLATMGPAVGLEVCVVDARPVFADPARFPGAREVVRGQPATHLAAAIASGRVDPSTSVVSLLHDERVEVPLLAAALASPAGYVGALGSRRTHAARQHALAAAAVAEEDLDRLRGPVGLDLGGSTPAEVALSILAELTALRHGGSGRPLRELPRSRPVHPPVSASSVSAPLSRA